MDIKNDSVFQVSLTEIAFTLILLLVLLLGLKITDLTTNVEKQKKITETQRLDLEKKTREIKSLQDLISHYGGICKPDPEDPIDPMMPCVKCVSVMGKISKKEASEAISLGRSLLEQYNAHDGQKNISYEDFAEQLKKAAAMLASGDKLPSPEEVRELNDKAEELSALQNDLEQTKATLRESENSLQSCQKSNAYFKRRAGMDYPPCWTNEEGRIQYLLNVELLPDGTIVAQPGWPTVRQADAQNMPSVVEMTQKGPMSLAEFSSYAAPILQLSDHAKPEACRHFVRMKNRIPDRKNADNARLRVENYFYKYEVR